MFLYMMLGCIYSQKNTEKQFLFFWVVFKDFLQILGHGLRGPRAFFSVFFLFFMFLAHVLSLKVEIITKQIVLPPNGDGIPRAYNF